MGDDDRRDTAATLLLPCQGRPSIWEVLSREIAQRGPDFDLGSVALPDEGAPRRGAEAIRWAAGAQDGVSTHHLQAGDSDEFPSAHAIAECVAAYCQHPTVQSLTELYDAVAAASMISLVDDLLPMVMDDLRVDSGMVYELARRLVLESADREPVKFGIALLANFGQSADVELINALGRHDEFTLFCAVALQQIAKSPDEALWQLAQRVHGWGRIHVVERLAETKQPAIKDWLLREGFRNTVTEEYLAVICARAGDLASALQVEPVDRPLLTAAGELIVAMLRGGPAEDIGAYEDAALALERYVQRVSTQGERLQDVLTVHAIAEYLNQDEDGWRERSGWTEASRLALREQCRSILERAGWAEVVRAELASVDEGKFHVAATAAAALGIEVWDLLWQRLNAFPQSPLVWSLALDRCADERIVQLVEMAVRHLDLGSLSVGPGMELCIGPGFERHACVDFLLQALGRFPGHGAPIIEASLQSPCIRHRNLAVSALAAWPDSSWPPAARDWLRRAVPREPEARIRRRLQELVDR